MSDQVMAADCEHFYATHVRGGEPVSVRACTLCGQPDWPDLREQVAAVPPIVTWRPGSEAPKDYGLFWAREDFYANGVTIALHEGKGRWLVDGSDDCSVGWWAPIVYPADPGPGPADDGDED